MIESEAYSELCQTSKVDYFAKIVNGFKKITIFKRNAVLEIFDIQDFEHVSANIFQLYHIYPTISTITFESIETFTHFLPLGIQITRN